MNGILLIKKKIVESLLTSTMSEGTPKRMFPPLNSLKVTPIDLQLDSENTYS